MSKFLKGYKGFNKGLVCREKQYEENKVFEEKEASICESGMHFCKNPFDVLDYYDLVNYDGSFNDFAEVEALEESKTDDNKKYCTTKLKIGAKLSFTGFIKACIDFTLEKTKFDVKQFLKENLAQIGSSGYGAKINSTGHDSVICCAGYNAAVKAKKGSWITLSEWEYSEEKQRYIPVCVKTEFVDGERIKEDTLYKLKSGEFVEV